MHQTCTAARGAQRFSLQTGIAVLLVQVLFQSLGRVMQEIAAQPEDRKDRDDFFVHRLVAPASVLAMEQAYAPVGITLAVSEPASQKSVAARHGVDEAARRLELGDDRIAQVFAKAFVRI